MIISASRRTDIPALYGEWFCNRVREGYLLVRNPMNEHQVSRIALTRDVVDCIVFWTKDPAPLLPRLEALDGYPYYTQVTVTGYGREVEAGLASKRDVVIPAFREMSERVGPQRMVWRYDPILFSDAYTPERHLRAFAAIAAALEGATERCVISFLDLYPTIRKRMGCLGVHGIAETELRGFCRELAGIAASHGITVQSCAEKIDLASCGIEHGACIDRTLIERIVGAKLDVGKDTGQRPECACCASVEVGTYSTCTNGCAYCYANRSAAALVRAGREYDPHSPMLCDRVRDGDVVTERPMRSLIDRQLALNL